MDEKILLSEKPTWVVIVPHLIAMCFIVGIFTIWKPLIAILTTRLTITNRRVEIIFDKTSAKNFFSIEI